MTDFHALYASKTYLSPRKTQHIWRAQVDAAPLEVTLRCNIAAQNLKLLINGALQFEGKTTHFHHSFLFKGLCLAVVQKDNDFELLLGNTLFQELCAEYDWERCARPYKPEESPLRTLARECPAIRPHAKRVSDADNSDLERAPSGNSIVEFVNLEDSSLFS